MKLEDIGFYTLEDERAITANRFSPLHRCELILTDSCNFNCPYCRPMRDDCVGTMPFATAVGVLDKWLQHELRNVRFSGGEPTLYRDLDQLVAYCKAFGTKRIAISTNGSAPTAVYNKLLLAGVTDFSVSFDACCSSTAESMSGQAADFRTICDNIEWLASRTYTTVGVVLNDKNQKEAAEIIALAHSLGVADIRIITAAQYGKYLKYYEIPKGVLAAHPILKYRLQRTWEGEPIRGIREKDTKKCPLVLDDMAIAGKYHFPCIIYFRERGNPIGKIDQSIDKIRDERARWFESHDTCLDAICAHNCLDVCVAYNNKWEKFHHSPTLRTKYFDTDPVIQNIPYRLRQATGRDCNAGPDTCCSDECDG